MQALRDAEQAHDAACARLEALEADDPAAEPTQDELIQLADEIEAFDALLQPLTLANADPVTARATLRRLLDGPGTIFPVVDAEGELIAWEVKLSGDFSRLISQVGPLPSLPELTNFVGRSWITRWVAPAPPRNSAH